MFYSLSVWYIISLRPRRRELRFEFGEHLLEVGTTAKRIEVGVLTSCGRRPSSSSITKSRSDANPYDFQESKNRRRFDVSRNSCRARNDIELSPNDIEVRANDIEKARPVDFWSLLVAFRSVFATSAGRVILDVTPYASLRYVKKPRNRSVICDQKVAF